MQWNNSYFFQDPLDPLLLNDNYNYTYNIDDIENETEIHLFPSIESSTVTNAVSVNNDLNDDYINNNTFNTYYYYNDNNDITSQIPSSIDTSLSNDNIEFNKTRNDTIDVSNLKNSKFSPILKSSTSISSYSLSLSPVSSTRFSSITSSPNTEIENRHENVNDTSDEDEEDHDHCDNDKILNNLHLNPNSKSTKKISDSRLSLAQLSIVLNLQGNEEEAGKREKNILNILKNDLNFPIGEKTWIRDTPLVERDRIIHNLTDLVETKFKYGYNKRILSIIVRRASYYMMQGRLRRERRLKRKRKSTNQL